MDLVSALEERFGKHRVRPVQNPLHPDQAVVFLYLELKVPVTVLMTNGLSDYRMPVLDQWKGREHNELFFCLPTYWDTEDLANPNSNWVYHWLYKLEQFVREKQTWFGPGHTIPCGNPPAPLSATMKEEYLIFLDPIFLDEALRPIETGDRTTHFLSIVPLYGDELDYKMGKSAYKLLKRFKQRKVDERLDDYRSSVLSSRMRFF